MARGQRHEGPQQGPSPESTSSAIRDALTTDGSLLDMLSFSAHDDVYRQNERTTTAITIWRTHVS